MSLAVSEEQPTSSSPAISDNTRHLLKIPVSLRTPLQPEIAAAGHSGQSLLISAVILSNLATRSVSPRHSSGSLLSVHSRACWTWSSHWGSTSHRYAVSELSTAASRSYLVHPGADLFHELVQLGDMGLLRRREPVGGRRRRYVGEEHGNPRIPTASRSPSLRRICLESCAVSQSRSSSLVQTLGPEGGVGVTISVSYLR